VILHIIILVTSPFWLRSGSRNS